MCDMQKMMPTNDANCSDEDPDMNFAAFSTMGATGTHFVTTGGQLPVTKLQQSVANNGNSISQVVGMVGGVGDGVQYVRTLEGGAIHAAPQLITVPISLPGAKPGDPQPTVQIQVLNPNIALQQQQQQSKYQMQIPIQGFQQGGAVLTLAYSQDPNDPGAIHLVTQNGLPEGLQMVTQVPQEMQLIQTAQTQDTKDHVQQQQVYITPTQQIIISNPEERKTLNNNNNECVEVVVKEECEDIVVNEDIAVNEDESSQGTESSETITWQMSSSSQQDLIKYLNTLPPQQTQQLPASLQQFLRLNPAEVKTEQIEIEISDIKEQKEQPITEAVIDEDGTIYISPSKKKKKYKKKPPRPAKTRPGQVVIATAADGSPIYCCPECNMAYPDKGHLEMHLVIHKVERRFICGICGAGLKRKEHLERHKLGHNPERPYVCPVCRKGFKRREHLNLHTVIHSDVKAELCGECGKGFRRKDHLRKHTRSHENKRAVESRRHDGGAEAASPTQPAAAAVVTAAAAAAPSVVLPEITIHMPTSGSSQPPVQINIPPHMLSSLTQDNAQAHIDALLARHLANAHAQ